MKTMIRFAILFFTMSSTAHVFAANEDLLEIGIDLLRRRNSLTEADMKTEDHFRKNVLEVCNATKYLLTSDDDKEAAILSILARMGLEIPICRRTAHLPPPAKRKLDLGKASAVRLEGAKDKVLNAFAGTMPPDDALVL